MQPVLRSDLLTLRPLRAVDFRSLYAVAADPLVWEQHPEPDRCKIEVFKAFFRTALDSQGALLTIDAHSGQTIGSSRFHAYNERQSEIEIGWTFLARSHWGGRYNGEMKRLMLEHAFNSVERVNFVIGPQNRRSQRAVEKIGGQRAASRFDTAGKESFVYALTRETYVTFSHAPLVRPLRNAGTSVTAMTVKAQFPDEQSADGAFVRQDDAFRDWVTADGQSGYPAASGRYHLYVSLACPWAHRTVIVRRLKRLETAIGMTVVDPIRDDRGWAFRDVPGAERDPLNGFLFLAEAYTASDLRYRGRVTVPVLWDRETRRIVSNSDDDIMRMLEREFDVFGDPAVDLYPVAHRDDIDALNARIYEAVNNGVYEAGFATAQDTYAQAAQGVFSLLDKLDSRLATRRYLFGAQPLETDWRLFVTLVRFDAVYVGHFKCNLRRIVDYPNLWGYLRDLYSIEGIAETVNLDHIKRHYYSTHDDINPTGIVPIGPSLDFTTPHGRERLSPR